MIEFYIDANGEHRWRITAENNEIIDAATQGFASKQMAQKNLRLSYEAMKAHFEDGE